MVLLIAGNRTTTLVAPFPLGLAFVAGSLKRAGRDVAVLDLMFRADWQAQLKETLQAERPDVIGLTVRNIDNQDARNPIFHLDENREIMALCREHSRAQVVLGGSGFNIHPAGCMEYLGADLGIYGEGEEAFPLLLEALDKKQGLEAVPGAVWRKNNSVVVNAPRKIADMDRSAAPDYSLFDTAAYFNDTQGTLPGCVTIQGKRGCHMKCIYCSTPALEGTQCRLRAVTQVVQDMAMLNREQGVTRFYVADNVFNFPVPNAKEFCREILRQGLDVQWQAIMNPAFGDDELFALMSEAGCSFMSLGNEHGTDLLLRNLGKGFTLKNVRTAAERARKNGIRFGCFLLFGGPGETRDTVTEAIDFVQSLEPDLVTLRAGIRIYPGTRLEALARREGVISQDQDLLSPAFYQAPELHGWVWDYLEQECAKRENWRM